MDFERDKARMLTWDWELLAPISKAADEWAHARCVGCGEEVQDRSYTFVGGHGCPEQTVLRAEREAREADEAARERGWEPQEPYPGSRTKRRTLKCTTCGTVERRTLQSLGRCRHGAPAPKRAPTDPEAQEALAFERIRAVGWEPGPYGGSLTTVMAMTCPECGFVAHRKPGPKLASCTHPEGLRKAQQETRAEREKRVLLRYRLRYAKEQTEQALKQHGLKALEPYPGPDQPMWVECKHCSRRWSMSSSKIKPCPHKGREPRNAPPRRKTHGPALTPPPTTFSADEGWELQRAVLQLFTAWLDRDPATGLYKVDVYERDSYLPQEWRWRQLDSLIVADAADSPPLDQAEQILTSVEWEPEGEWVADDGGHRIDVTTGMISLYEITGELIHSEARDPETSVAKTLENMGVHSFGTYKKPGSHRRHHMYYRGKVFTALAARDARAAEEARKQAEQPD
ncbi:hypothetical protein ACIQNU_04600 [Streptomyces sp. NPDC091292]|uniref:hypothetical protein n=1 Tax=Streptomyces sp. NPDC091292 TaxID=3365991 RepID=UPI0037FE1C27